MYFRSKNQALLDNRYLPTRQFDKIKFLVLNPMIKIAFRSPNYLGGYLWDLLPKDTQISPGINAFKVKVTRHIKDGLFKDLKFVLSVALLKAPERFHIT